MEDQSSLLQGTMQEDSFEVVMRGYNRRQVDDYVLQCQHHIRDLAQRLALAEQEIDRVRTEAVMAVEKASAKPVHEEVSDRLAQILRLANEEAERERTNAAEEIAVLRAEVLADSQNLREQAHRDAEEVRRQVIAESDALRARAEVETETLCQRVEAETEVLRETVEREAAETRARAEAEAERVLTDARVAAEQDVAQARAVAQQFEETSRSEAERRVLAAQRRADGVLGDAQRRADMINTGLGERLAMLTMSHTDVVQRLSEMRKVLVDVLRAEELAGPFDVPADGEVPDTGDVLCTAPSTQEMVARQQPEGWPGVVEESVPDGSASGDGSGAAPTTGPIVVTLNDERAVPRGKH
ncbi:MAG: hypothetical protein QG622_179 [Actinomycetota bacterium]|nr:hypothetical protein [Actinomycetota bacterium]